MGLTKKTVFNANILPGDLLTVDGAGSLLDADLLDGYHYADIITNINSVINEKLGNIETLLAAL